MAGAVERPEATVIGAAEVKAVAELARLALRPGEAEEIARDLRRILQASRMLASVDLAGVDPSYTVGADNDGGPDGGSGTGRREARLRPDEALPGLTREAALAAAPAQDGAFFLVPTVVERT